MRLAKRIGSVMRGLDLLLKLVRSVKGDNFCQEIISSDVTHQCR